MANAYSEPITANDLEDSLREFQRAHDYRMTVLQDGDHRAVAEAIRSEREAICRHAAALRANAVRIARSQ